jgi:hypothetical protein
MRSLTRDRVSDLLRLQSMKSFMYRRARRENDMRSRTIFQCCTLLGMFGWLAACGDDDPCKAGRPVCVSATFDEKTCTCGPLLDAGATLGADSAIDAAQHCSSGTASCAAGSTFNPQTCLCDRMDAAAASSCAMPLAVQDAGAGVVACNVERAYVECGNCACLSADPATCEACGEPRMCTNRCQANEYAVGCGGPPRHDGMTYADSPTACRSVANLPSGTGIYCCPCS